MTLTEKYEINTLLTESEAKVLTILADVEETQFLAKAEGDKWSMAEVVEHLIITDNSIFQGILHKAQSLYEVAPETTANGKILKIVPDLNRGKVIAPDYLQPKGKFQSKAEALEAFSANRAIIRNFMATTDLPLDQIAFKHFSLGLLNAKNWLVFISGHCFRHTQQLEAMKQ